MLGPDCWSHEEVAAEVPGPDEVLAPVEVLGPDEVLAVNII